MYSRVSSLETAIFDNSSFTGTILGDSLAKAKFLQRYEESKEVVVECSAVSTADTNCRESCNVGSGEGWTRAICENSIKNGEGEMTATGTRSERFSALKRGLDLLLLGLGKNGWTSPDISQSPPLVPMIYMF